MKTNRKKKVLLAISGGVDSSVSAFILKKQGYEVVGAFMKFWKESSKDTEDNKCCSMESLRDAREVMNKIGGKLYVINFKELFKKQVVDYFIESYAMGETPNPCVRCNKFVKLGALYKKAEELGCDFVATGHYARIKRTRNEAKNSKKYIYKLFAGIDKTKDQTYFLYNLNQEKLSKTLFPVGDMKKTKVSKMANKLGINAAKKKESQEICFVPDKTHYEFLRNKIQKSLTPGPILFNNEKIGEHKGLPLYTIGQRKGIEIGGVGPFYVLKCDYKTNTLFVTDKFDDDRLFSKSMRVKNISWISGVASEIPFDCKIKIRYGHEAVDGKIISAQKDIVELEFEKPERAITIGQSAVFYLKNEVIGGGEITKSI